MELIKNTIRSQDLEKANDDQSIKIVELQNKLSELKKQQEIFKNEQAYLHSEQCNQLRTERDYLKQIAQFKRQRISQYDRLIQNRKAVLSEIDQQIHIFEELDRQSS